MNLDNNIDIKNKTVLITGATTGIGKETAIDLAKDGAKIYMTARDMEKGIRVMDEIINISNNPNVFVMHCDFASLDSICRFCDEFLNKVDSLHILINNAGIMKKKHSKTIDGIETTFAVNHLAPFLMTNLLLDLIKRSAPARIVNVASDAHYRAKINFDDIGFDKSYPIMGAYSQSKLANVLFTKHLAELLKDQNITVNCLMPGVVATDLMRDYNQIIRFFFKLIFISPQKGAETIIYLAKSKDVNGVTGEYFDKCQIKKASEEAYNMEIAKKLWVLSSELVNL